MREAMEGALKLARQAADAGDVPVGCVILGADGVQLAAAANTRERDGCVLGHAELVALREATARLGSWRLDGATLVVTLEPCLMCAGAISQSRLARVVFAARDPKAGAVVSLYSVLDDPRLNHRVAHEQGLMEAEAVALLQTFFAARRARGDTRRASGAEEPGTEE